MTLVKAS